MTRFIRITACVCALLSISALGEAAAGENRFAREVEELLQKKIKVIENLAADPQMIRLVRESNQKNKDLTLRERYKLDEKWRKVKGIDDFIRPFVSNECATALLVFQERHEGFSEIFIADATGLIVGGTNKTSDYYQADELWWIQTFNDGKGKSDYGNIEYDDSAEVEAIALYAPVIDPETNRAIGVIKSIYKIDTIIMEL